MSAALGRSIPAQLTTDEFLVWDAPGPERWQLIDGQPVAMAPASETHGVLLGQISYLLRAHFIERGSPCRVIVAPGVVPQVRAQMNFRIPDLGVSCAPPGQDSVVRQPTILIEVLSPSNKHITRANVWAYTTIPSVQEILLLQSSRIEAEVLRRGADRDWPEHPEVIGPDGTLTLDSIGFSAPLASLYDTSGLTA